MRHILRRVAALVAVAAFAASASAAPARAAGPDYSFISSGETAEVWWSQSGYQVSVYVTRGEYRGQPSPWLVPSAFLSYTVKHGTAVESGSGMVSPEVFTGSLATGLTLEIDTSTIAPSGLFTRIGPGGMISLSWTRAHDWRSNWSGRSEMTFESAGWTQTLVLIGSRETFSATAAGSVLGVTAPDGAYATVGQNHQVQHTYITQQ